MSGGWTYAIDFAPHGSRIGMYRNGTGGGTNYSTFDDGVTQGALRLIMQVDRALGFKNAVIHEASEVARSAVYAAQFQNGGFPQGWAAPVQPHPAVRASYPDYDWRTENRIKNYWDLPTLNDDLASRVVQALADAWEIYKDERAHEAILRFGNFLLLAQMPDPQPGWAQQYDHEMHPAWARKFEPPAIAGRESEDVIETLLRIHRLTHDAKYLDPIPRALEYLRHSVLPDGRLARYYELKTNQPLYMTKSYDLTHDDSDAPTHYGWKTKSKLERLEKHYAGQKAGKSMTEGRPSPPNEKELQEILQSLDEQGRWISTYSGPGGFVGQLKLPQGTAFLASEVFARNMEDLAAYVMAARQQRP
jgi:PelA/Pel-15E family pectate lyase